MKDMEAKPPKDSLVLEYEIDAPPEKVWRAISIPELREKWMPEKDLTNPDPISAEPGVEVRYRVLDKDAPFRESTVTFQVRPNVHGGTKLRIVHQLVDARTVRQTPPAANNNWPGLMRAA
jgi:uncharacterized protein YndB with AHSA1/START domain